MKAPEMPLNQQDLAFIKRAAAGGMAEILISRLAVERSDDDEIRQFSRRMIDDHGKANAELMQLAASKGADVDDNVDTDHQDLLNELNELEGLEFDSAYMEVMVQDHLTVVSEFKLEIVEGRDNEIKFWAVGILPKLQEHLRLARQLIDRT